ncbi:unnamed protein product [Linum trigynum]|uniref:Uncharacterized protein n=1 Tax=Linum trigynum TaxID=586398 RepID=A0AAV2DWQ1_9ROSI
MLNLSFEQKKKTTEEYSLSKMGDNVKGDAPEAVDLEDRLTDVNRDDVEGDKPKEVDLSDNIFKTDGSSDGLCGLQDWMAAVDEIKGGM